MKASDLFVKALEAEGVEYVFGIPGEENLDFLDSLSRSNIKLVLTRNEQAAGFMAATYGRLTGKAGICLSTLGPGATNFVTAAAYAQLGGMPMMMITRPSPMILVAVAMVPYPTGRFEYFWPIHFLVEVVSRGKHPMISSPWGQLAWFLNWAVVECRGSLEQCPTLAWCDRRQRFQVRP
jgi:hypothetical protein